MSYPPTGSAAPPAPPPAPEPAATGTPGAEPPPPSGERAVWAEGLRRLRAAATTEPGRLRIIGAVLAALVVLFGALTAWQVTDRSAAASDVLESSQPLSRDAADIYRSLADADTTAAGGFLAGDRESAASRKRYTDDIATAARLLVRASANSQGSATAREEIERLNNGLPRYTGLVETARMYNRQGLPVGGAYLQYANDRMRTQLLPAARRLYVTETGRLDADHDDATAWPWVALAAGVLAVGGLGWAQRRTYLRTNRVFNRGLLIATAASAVALLWTVGGHAVARAGLDDSIEHGARSLRVLNEARIATLQARGDENLTLVARGGKVTGPDQRDFYEVEYAAGMRDLAGTGQGSDAAVGGKLREALALADDEAGRAPVRDALKNVREWQSRHAEARAENDRGDYQGALAKVIGTDRPTKESFDKVEAALQQALRHEQAQFRDAAEGGRRALTGLAGGAAVLAVLAAAGAVLGIGRRLSEYR
ncbi:hypothetical protein [Streptomyces niger]|uniref:hypothetical protein n=1 Tax=Streptomyces niger TaxID=66373 RepID=UPI00069AF1FD|nr:hypothetical protein [Streptomyces niger]